ncbi:phage integrase SAM-like domain-containing protein [Chryseobacterium sp.]|uniref:tyrosine-type recombinase/integrase n=1 Tax=Chryseobacterium sp. TaxID=1871047 RepID=UPI0024E1A236|nr:phage integrase SAM-like domain-containing protein [Chryseobacterium sp.]
MATVKYYLRSKSKETNIQMQLSVSRDLKMRTSTGLIISYTDWSDRTSLPKQNNSHTKNIIAQLSDLRNFVLNEYNKDFVNGVLFNTNWLKGKINIFFERTDTNVDDNFISNYLKKFNELRKLDSRTKDSTDYQFIVLAQKITNFQKSQKKDYTFPEVDKRVMLEFKNWLTKTDNLMESTALRTLKNFKTVLLDARDNGKTIHNQINTFSIASKPALKVFLDFQEIEQIKNTVIVGKDIQFAKDWLIIGCYTGQRVSDLLRMNRKMIFTKTDADGDSFKFIELTQEKTGKDVTIPLHDEVEKILTKYDGDFPPTFSDTTFASNVSIFNYNLKKICKLAGIKTMVKGKVFNEKLGKNEIKDTEKFNLVSSHICRRSFATNFYGDKRFTTPQIMAITGHSTEVMFLSYIGKTSSDHAIITAKTFREIKQQKTS